ncbi:hypothetical protein HN958_00725 [Candidatus Falkowbacteria bacterium]|jgi:hypothetical protein|nr:hypothetical protein [Candidatus Falkowbacteria bacterium]MBT7007014.1 hypothetical protein [Candidatus Falkowbacteria bacterium]
MSDQPKTQIAHLRVIEKGNVTVLAFASQNDAETFRNFVLLYMEETGTINMNDGYWLDVFSKVFMLDHLLPNSDTQLDEDLIQTMIKSIIENRLAGGKTKLTAFFALYAEGDLITFSMPQFPPRLTPEIGDSCRAFSPSYLVGNGAVYYVEVCGESLTVVSTEDKHFHAPGTDVDEDEPESTNVTIGDEAIRYTLPVVLAMKVPDPWDLD